MQFPVRTAIRKTSNYTRFRVLVGDNYRKPREAANYYLIINDQGANSGFKAATKECQIKNVIHKKFSFGTKEVENGFLV